MTSDSLIIGPSPSVLKIQRANIAEFSGQSFAMHFADKSYYKV